MRIHFNSHSGISAAERALDAYQIEYKKLPSGRIVVPGNIQINMENLRELPDFSDVIVKGNFECVANRLTSLKGAPAWVGGDFLCSGNELTSLQYSPKHVGGSFECYSNDLYSLEGAPRSIGETFNTHGSPLDSLEHAPKKFKKLVTKHGAFNSWEEVPVNLQMSQKTKERLHQEALQDDAVFENTVLQSPVRITKPLSLRKT